MTERIAGAVEAVLSFGQPLTIKEIQLWVNAVRPGDVQGHLLRLEQRGQATRFKAKNLEDDLWIATVLDPRRTGIQVLVLIAKKNHSRETGHRDVWYGANYVECTDCGKHAHVGADYERPLVCHGSEHRSGTQETYEHRLMRPQDF